MTKTKTKYDKKMNATTCYYINIYIYIYKKLYVPCVNWKSR